MKVRNLGLVHKGNVPVEVTKHLDRVKDGENHDMYSEMNKSTGRLMCVCLTCEIQWENE